MKYTVAYPSQNGARAYVLGAVQDSNNIGDRIADKFGIAGFTVIGDDGAVGDGSRPAGGNLPDDETAERYGYNVTLKGRYQRFEAPSVSAFQQADADALIITLGKTAKDHFTEIADWDVMNMIKANLVLPLQAARRFVQAANVGPAGKASHDNRIRHIVFVGSYAHNHPFTNGTLYCAAKAGLDMAARTLGWELTDRGYRVHIVHPYHVNGTPMWAQVEQDVMRSKGMTFEEADAYNRKDLKMPDLLTPDEVAEVVYQVVNNKALNWITGPIELYGGSR